MATCQKVGQAIHSVHRPVRVSLTIISIIIPHVHIHLVPLNAVAELDFTKQDQNARAEDLDASAEAIRQALRRMPSSPALHH
jgi:diadenosine tetraphosphate (Ap4A) HIT family hydrolase